jgi:hypothetical protein
VETPRQHVLQEVAQKLRAGRVIVRQPGVDAAW